MKNRDEKDIFQKTWIFLIVTIYILLIVSLGFLGYHIFRAPVPESPPPNDVVMVHVTNKGNESMNMTVKMIDDSWNPIWKHFNATNNITSFSEKTIEPEETVTFKTDPHSTYDNFPMEIRVYRTDDGEELLTKKRVRLTLGQSNENEREFSIDVNP